MAEDQGRVSRVHAPERVVNVDNENENRVGKKDEEVDKNPSNETERLQAFSALSTEEIEDLLYKNTSSFRCLEQILMSNSSLFRHILYNFPPLDDPGIDEAFDHIEPEMNYDDIGCEKYKNMCKKICIAPITRVLKSLSTETLNLKYYGLSFKQLKAICTTLMRNSHVKNLILQDNFMTPEGAVWLGEMLRENNSIQVLNLRECRLHPEGINNMLEAFSSNQSLRELDLSFNSLGDEGLECLIYALKGNQEIQKLILSHNNLGDSAGKALGNFLEENTSLIHLDLSWNDLYSPTGLKPLCTGLTNNTALKYLNLSWNAIGTPNALGPIVKYLKTTEILEHFNLSNNRLMGPLLKTIRDGIVKNTSLLSINLGFNPITPSEALFLVNAFNVDDLKLKYMDLENVFVEKNFLPVWNKLTRRGKNVRIQGVFDNFKIHGPNKVKLLFERCKFLAQKPKKKKQKRDFGHFIYSLPDTSIEKKEFQSMMKKFKIKLDLDLVALLSTTFTKSGKISLPYLKDTYLMIYPDTERPLPKKKKDNKGRKGKKKIESSTDESLQDETKYSKTPSLQMSSTALDENQARLRSTTAISGMLQSRTALDENQIVPKYSVTTQQQASSLQLDENQTISKSSTSQPPQSTEITESKLTTSKQQLHANLEYPHLEHRTKIKSAEDITHEARQKSHTLHENKLKHTPSVRFAGVKQDP